MELERREQYFPLQVSLGDGQSTLAAANQGELEDAALKDAGEHFPLPNNAWFWSSTTKGKNTAFAINLYTGVSGYYSTKSYIDAIPVYRAFTP